MRRTDRRHLREKNKGARGASAEGAQAPGGQGTRDQPLESAVSVAKLKSTPENDNISKSYFFLLKLPQSAEQKRM